MKILSLVAILIVAGASLPASAQTASPSDVPSHKKSAPLGTMKVQSHKTTHQPRIASNQSGSSKSGGGKHLTAGYMENDFAAAPFGSQHWWTVHGWQSGGSSPP